MVGNVIGIQRRWREASFPGVSSRRYAEFQRGSKNGHRATRSGGPRLGADDCRVACRDRSGPPRKKHSLPDPSAMVSPRCSTRTERITPARAVIYSSSLRKQTLSTDHPPKFLRPGPISQKSVLNYIMEAFDGRLPVHPRPEQWSGDASPWSDGAQCRFRGVACRPCGSCLSPSVVGRRGVVFVGNNRDERHGET